MFIKPSEYFQQRESNSQKTLWPESVSELYWPSDHRLSAKLLPTFADRGCHVVSMTDPYGCILSFLDQSTNKLLSLSLTLKLKHTKQDTKNQENSYLMSQATEIQVWFSLCHFTFVPGLEGVMNLPLPDFLYKDGPDAVIKL
jgi:hypothetical protein